MQLVAPGYVHGFAIGDHGVPRDTDDLPVAFVGFFNGVLTKALDGHTGSTRVTLERRVGSIQLRGIRLAGGSAHIQGVAIHFVGEGGAVVGNTVNFRGAPRSRDSV